ERSSLLLRGVRAPNSETRLRLCCKCALRSLRQGIVLCSALITMSNLLHLRLILTSNLCLGGYLRMTSSSMQTSLSLISPRYISIMLLPVDQYYFTRRIGRTTAKREDCTSPRRIFQAKCVIL